MYKIIITKWTYFILLGLANICLIIPGLRLLGAVAIAFIMPGWGWANKLLSGKQSTESNFLAHFALSVALSFSMTTISVLALHYMPGSISFWALLILLNIMAILPFTFGDTTVSISPSFPPIGLIIIILIAVLLRFSNLGYSEFQGDEALALIFSAEAIEGHEDALFLRGKGPGELLPTIAMWRFIGTISEATARMPFAIAGMMSIIAMYLLAEKKPSTIALRKRREGKPHPLALPFEERGDSCSPPLQGEGKFLFHSPFGRGAGGEGVFATGVVACSGLMVGFGRIVQYQTIVVWMSILSLWACWQWQEREQKRWAFVSGLFLGIGLLAHYDAILVIPALAWMALSIKPDRFLKSVRFIIMSVALWLFAFLATTLLFYIPYYLDPQISQTGSYLSERIGDGSLTNNLYHFLTFNSFYSSFYYTLFMGILLICFIGWQLRHIKWLAILSVAMMIMIAMSPSMFGNWTGIPLALILLTVFISPHMTQYQRVILIWFAVPFLGYNFLVAKPLTHIYTVIPAWSLLVGKIFIPDSATKKPYLHGASKFALTMPRFIYFTISYVLLALSFVYLWNAFLRTDTEFLNDYPQANIPIYWTPYPKPDTGFFGFVHKTGWKSVGALIADGKLHGDYGSNEEQDVTSWYTRHAERACDFGAEFYFIADDLVDEVRLENDNFADHAIIGESHLANEKGLQIWQRKPTTLYFGELNHHEFARRFDKTATPDMFARKPQWEHAIDANFAGLIRLHGYDVNVYRAYPGGRILLTLYWSALVPIEPSYKVFVHLDSDKKYAQADGLPACHSSPTNLWRVDQIITDYHALSISVDTPLEKLPLVIGWYQPQQGERLDILDVAGNPVGVSMTLTDVIIRHKPHTSSIPKVDMLP